MEMEKEGVVREGVGDGAGRIYGLPHQAAKRYLTRANAKWLGEATRIPSTGTSL